MVNRSNLHLLSKLQANKQEKEYSRQIIVHLVPLDNLITVKRNSDKIQNLIFNKGIKLWWIWSVGQGAQAELD